MFALIELRKAAIHGRESVLRTRTPTVIASPLRHFYETKCRLARCLKERCIYNCACETQSLALWKSEEKYGLSGRSQSASTNVIESFAELYGIVIG